MNPRFVHIHYRIDGSWTDVRMIGARVTDAPRPPYHRGSWPEEFQRRLHPQHLVDQPCWLLDLIERYRPTPNRCSQDGT